MAAATVWDLFQHAVDDSGSRDAVVDPANRSELCGSAPRRLSFNALQQEVLSLAAALAASGVRRGDILMVQLPNTVELPMIYLAAARLGAVISPAPMQYRAHELSMIIGSAEPVAIISISRFKGESPLAEFDALVDKGVLDSKILRLCVDGEAPGWQSLPRLMTDAAPLDRNLPTPDAESLFTLCWTSGTTGTPKGVPRRHRHWLAMIPSFEDATALPANASMLAPFPMVNMAAISVFLIYWLSVRGKLVLHHPMDLSVFLEQIEQEQAVYTVAPPALLSLLLAKPELLDSRDVSSLSIIGSGSAPLTPGMITGFKEKLGVDVVNMFGSNEGCCLVSDATDVPDPAARANLFPRFGAPGFSWHNRIAQSFKTRLVDVDSGNEIVEAKTPGELLIKGPTVFEGYWRSEHDNDGLFDQEGFFRTGDLFEITGDNNAFYRFVGRNKDLIVRGGMKISPEEIDQLLSTHPHVLEAAVAAMPDEHLGQRVCAFVVMKDSHTLSLEQICDHLAERGLARFKWPEKMVQLQALPRNPLGKVVRHTLENMH